MPFWPPGGGGDSSGVTDVTFPLSGDGVSVPLVKAPWLNKHTIYVSPTGNDSRDGTSLETAMLTPELGFDALAALSGGAGGTLSIEHGCTGFLWLRDDGLLPSGWRTSMPVDIVYRGGPTSNQFAYQTAGSMTNGAPSAGANRWTPPIWIISSGVPITISNALLISTGTNFRFGWDYRRKHDGTQTIDWANITSWARNNSNTTSVPINGDGVQVTYASVPTAVVTVALPTGINITGAVRVGTEVQLTFASISPVPLPITAIGQPIYVTSSDSDFPSGTKLVTSWSATTLDYTEAGAAVTKGAIGSWSSHGLMARDRIEVASTSAEVCQTAYKVISVDSSDAHKFTVTDYYGNVSGRTPTITVSNPGTWVGQNRGNTHSTGMVTLRNPQGYTTIASPDLGFGGPNIDYGNSADGRFLVEYANLNGGGYPLSTLDPDRAAWLLFDGGSTGATGGQIRHCRPNSGGIRMYGCTTASFGMNCTDIISDAIVGADEPPVAQVLDNAQAGIFTFDSCLNADGSNSYNNVVVDSSAKPGQVSYHNCGPTVGPGVRTGTSVWVGSGWENTGSPTLMQAGQSGFWATKRIAGRHPAQYRSVGGLNSARYANYFPAVAEWTAPSGGAVTAGQVDPFGGTQAVKITGTGDADFSHVIDMGANATGDRIVIASLYRREEGAIVGDIIYQVSGGNGLLFNVSNDIAGAGWQWLVGWQALTGSAVSLVSATYRNSGTTYHYQPMLIRVPAAVTDDEFAEYVETLRTQPLYLPVGSDGTGVDRVFYGHGGFGAAVQTKTVGANTGKVVPFYDAATGSLIGYINIVAAS